MREEEEQQYNEREFKIYKDTFRIIFYKYNIL